MRYVLKSWPVCSPSSKEMKFILLFTLKKLAKTIRIWKNYSNRSTIASQLFRRMHIFSDSKATRQPDGGLVKPHWS